MPKGRPTRKKLGKGDGDAVHFVIQARDDRGRWEVSRLEAFERMLADIQGQSEREAEAMRRLKAEGKEKTATYRQYFSNRMLYKMMLEKYRECGLLD